MQTVQPVTPVATGLGHRESSRSAVSWGAVIAGAVIAAAVSAMLIIGGSGFGFLAVSPWQNQGASGSAVAIGSIIWLFVAQIIAYSVAGYVAGRLRTKWTDAAVDEVYFRDTAHGFLVWALSAVIGLVILSTTVASIVSGTAKTGAALAGAGGAAAVTAAGQSGPSLNYFTDTLLRPVQANSAGASPNDRQEVTRILAQGIAQGKLSSDDQNYLVGRVAALTGTDQTTAQQRVNQIEQQAIQAVDQAKQKAREAADAARKAAATLSLWAFAAMLVGAFAASLFATIGGRARDR